MILTREIPVRLITLIINVTRRRYDFVVGTSRFEKHTEQDGLKHFHIGSQTEGRLSRALHI
jgi:hypothetical protein